MQDMLSRMNPGEFIGFVAVAFGGTAALVLGLAGILGGIWYAARKAESEAGLKRELVATGMSAEDIERVINVTTGGASAADLAKARMNAQVEVVKARGF